MQSQLTNLIGQKFNVLDDGYIILVDVMGNDEVIEQAARVSYGEGTRKVSETRGLIRYLMRHRHTTPFEMAELKFKVRVPMDCWRQWIRHRTASVNEYSTRYSEAIDRQQKTDHDQWRGQSETNKQGSDGGIQWPKGKPLCDDIPDAGEYLMHREEELHDHARSVYQERLKFGVAREQARKDLPLSTYTEAFWKIDLHNLFHFLSLRMDSHAQKEIRDYANTIGHEVIAKLFPLSWEAFVDYRLEGIFLSRLDIEIIQSALTASGMQYRSDDQQAAIRNMAQQFGVEDWQAERSRERDECLEKMKRLGVFRES